jgi:hypothetical protein
VFDPDAAALIEGGSALIVGTVASDGAPLATRGWAAWIVDQGPPARVRILLAETETEALENLHAAAAIAVTAADVPTLRSVQFKGRVEAVEPVGEADVERAERYIDALFADIERADGARREILARWIPSSYVAVTIEVAERFDQTPGPGAGAAIPSVAS